MAPILCSIAIGETPAHNEAEAFIQKVHQSLQNRIEKLIEAVPLLSCHVEGPRSLTPRFAQVLNKSLIKEKILGSILEDQGETEFSPESLMSSNMRWGDEELKDVSTAPLWRVRILRQSSLERTKFAIILITHHVITDGRALLGLSRVLFAPVEAKMPSSASLCGEIVHQALHGNVNLGNLVPPRSEEVNPHFKAPLTWVFASLSKILLSPLLPEHVRNILGIESLPWPCGEVFQTRSADALPVYHYVDFSNNPKEGERPLMERLKRCAKDHDIPSINPIFHTASLVALFVLYRNQKKMFDTEVVLTAHSDTPMSIRQEQQFGLVSGNYVLVVRCVSEVSIMDLTFLLQFPWSAKLSNQTKLWNVSRKYYEDSQYHIII